MFSKPKIKQPVPFFSVEWLKRGGCMRCKTEGGRWVAQVHIGNTNVSLCTSCLTEFLGVLDAKNYPVAMRKFVHPKMEERLKAALVYARNGFRNLAKLGKPTADVHIHCKHHIDMVDGVLKQIKEDS